MSFNRLECSPLLPDCSLQSSGEPTMPLKTFSLTLPADPRMSPLRSGIAALPPADVNSSLEQNLDVSPRQRTLECLPLADSGPFPSEAAFLPPHLQPSSANLSSSPRIRDSARPTFPRQPHFRPNLSIHRYPTWSRKRAVSVSAQARNLGPVPLSRLPDTLEAV